MLSKTAEYALRAVMCLAGDSAALISADTLAKRTKVPRRYLNRVLQDLAVAELVSSKPGPGGGYFLQGKPADVSLLSVVNAVSPVARIRECPLGLKSHKELCPLHAELDKAYAATEKAFAGVTIQEMLESTNPVIPLCEA